MSDDEDDTTSDPSGSSASPLWERILGGVGGLLLVAIVVLVLTGTSGPAVVTTEITEIRSTSTSTIYDVEVSNDGGETVEEVVVVGELRDGDGAVVATAEATVAFLPGGASQQVSLAFEPRPGVVDLEVAAVGWADA